MEQMPPRVLQAFWQQLAADPSLRDRAHRFSHPHHHEPHQDPQYPGSSAGMEPALDPDIVPPTDLPISRNCTRRGLAGDDGVSSIRCVMVPQTLDGPELQDEVKDAPEVIHSPGSEQILGGESVLSRVPQPDRGCYEQPRSSHNQYLDQPPYTSLQRYTQQTPAGLPLPEAPLQCRLRADLQAPWTRNVHLGRPRHAKQQVPACVDPDAGLQWQHDGLYSGRHAQLVDSVPSSRHIEYERQNFIEPRTGFHPHDLGVPLRAPDPMVRQLNSHPDFSTSSSPSSDSSLLAMHGPSPGLGGSQTLTDRTESHRWQEIWQDGGRHTAPWQQPDQQSDQEAPPLGALGVSYSMAGPDHDRGRFRDGDQYPEDKQAGGRKQQWLGGEMSVGRFNSRGAGIRKVRCV